MRGITKMTLANRSREGGNRGGSMETNNRGGNQGGSMEMNGRGGNSGMNNAYNAMETQTGGAQGNYGPENRRDSRGRYAPRNEGMDNAYGAYNGGMEGAYNEGGSMRMGGDKGWIVKPMDRLEEGGGPENWMPPYWENRMEGGRYRMGDDGGRMIGFEGAGENRMRMSHGQKKEMEQMQMGGSEEHEKPEKLDQRTAVEWVNKMKNSDGSHGEHFTMEQTERVRKNKGWECDPIEFWVAMNAMWSDGAVTAKKYNIDKIEYWADRAKEFIMDKDAGPGKMARYYKYIVKHE